MKLENEIQQKSFQNERHKAMVNILFTASWINGQQIQMLRPFEISWQQFNILRILRGRREAAISLKDISKRMVDRNSNTSRLIDKLQSKGLVSRCSNEADRRKVDIFITKKGLDLINRASEKMDTVITNRLDHLSRKEEKQLNQLLDKFRGAEK